MAPATPVRSDWKRSGGQGPAIPSSTQPVRPSGDNCWEVTRWIPLSRLFWGGLIADMYPDRDANVVTDGERPEWDVEEALIPVANTSAPHVCWYTPERFERVFGYPHNNPASVLRPEVFEEIRHEQRVRLTPPRLHALHRLARFWNGEAVRDGELHILADKVPPWKELFSDFDLDHLRPLQTVIEPADDSFVKHFGGYDWAQTETRTRRYLKPVTVLRRTVPYDLEEKGRTLINARDDLPSLTGDPYEGLKHRIGVGLEAARAALKLNRTVETYAAYRSGQYTVDLVEWDDQKPVVAEVLTDHNNNALYRSTVDKLFDLQFRAVLIFDTRSTATRVLNHWYDYGYDVPGAPFNSAPRLQWLQEKFAEAAADPTREWPIEDIVTITQLWNQVFDSAPPNRHEVVSLNW